MSDEQEYMLRWRGRESGPHSLAEINRRLDDHEIGMGHEIYANDKWMTLEEFFAAAAKSAAPAPARPATPPARDKLRIKTAPGSAAPAPVRVAAASSGIQPRHRLVFALLGVFLGFLGVHNFYARQWVTGLLQLLLSVATYLMGFGIIASWLWAMAEAVFVRKDGQDLDMV